MPQAKKQSDPEAQLATFLAKYTAEIRTIAEEARAVLRKRLPGAVEMVYDNYNALVIGFGSTERASEAIISIALYPRWVNLFFLEGVALPDPGKVLQGSGNQVRRIRLESAATLDEPAVRTLIKEAVRNSSTPFDKKAPRRLIIKSVAPKQRARRTPGPKTTADAAKHLKRVRRICMELPDVTEKLSHGAPTFFVSGRVFTMFADNHHGDGHIAVWIPAAAGLQAPLIAEAPDTYFRPPYVGSSGWVGVELGRVTDDVLTAHIREARNLILAKTAKRSRKVR
jgi:hypothetical protein